MRIEMLRENLYRIRRKYTPAHSVSIAYSGNYRNLTCHTHSDGPEGGFSYFRRRMNSDSVDIPNHESEVDMVRRSKETPWEWVVGRSWHNVERRYHEGCGDSPDLV